MTSRNAQASSFYVEFQGGASQFRGTETLFTSGTSDASDLGLGFNLGIFYSIPLDPALGMNFQMGFQHRFNTATQGGNYYSIQAPYGVVRMQFLSAYFSAGAAPLIFRRSAGSPGFEDYSSVAGGIAFLTEAGLLYSATPRFSLGGALGLQWFSVNSQLDSKPLADLTFIMRFYFGFSSAAGTAQNPLEYNGWRYIGK